MNHSRKYRAITAIVLTGAAALPVGNALAAASHSTATSKTKSYKGPLVDTRWGPMKAIIKVKNKKIISANDILTPETFRSQYIDSQAIPLLVQETLQAQNASINMISGATVTSAGYIQSLQIAVANAKHDKLLK
jgi:uncharacterized protein with FMN-binding domain